jgi:hypothetical protein
VFVAHAFIGEGEKVMRRDPKEIDNDSNAEFLWAIDLGEGCKTSGKVTKERFTRMTIIKPERPKFSD